MITIHSLQEAQSDEPREKILLPPTDPNAEVMEILGYNLVYVNGACPRNYRVYKANSMIGVIFQHITHWSNGVDSLLTFPVKYLLQAANPHRGRAILTSRATVPGYQ